jgi:hypothetical protein
MFLPLSENIKQQFERLLMEIEQIKRQCGWDGSNWYRWPPQDEYIRIRTQALNLIKISCGEGSEHFTELRRLAEMQNSSDSMHMMFVLGVIKAAFQDFQSGLLFEIESRIRADVLDDFIEQAEYLTKERCHPAAASLAGAVLEDTLRKMCERNGISYPEKTKIDTLNATLAKAKVYDKLVQKQITAYADLRNNADHGHFDKLRTEDVEDLIRWLRRFVTEHLSR